MLRDIISSYKLTTCPYIKYRIPRIVLTIFSNNNRLDSRSHEEAINKIKNNCDKYYPEINLRDLRKVFKEIETACVNTLQNEYTDYLFNLPPGI